VADASASGVGVDDVLHPARCPVDRADPSDAGPASVLDQNTVAAAPLLLVECDAHGVHLTITGSTLIEYSYNGIVCENERIRIGYDTGVDAQPPVVAMAEIGQLLGVSKRRVSMLIARPDFPAPIALLSAGRIWSYEQVKTWAENTGRIVHPIPAR